MNERLYRDFGRKLDAYLSTELSLSVFANFLRSNRGYQNFFQVCRDCHGQAQFIDAEVLFHYEHGSNYRVADKTFDKLLAEVSDDDFVRYPLPGRIRCDELDKFIETQKPDLRSAEGRASLRRFVESAIGDAQQFVDKLADFVHTQAKLPTPERNFVPAEPIEIPAGQSRGQIIDYLQQKRATSTAADLAFYAYRDIESCDWVPFIKAAMERNPVSIQMAQSMSVEQVCAWLREMNDVSIYDGARLAQPDEVANYMTGDGLEKAFLLANVIRRREPERDVEIVAHKNDVVLKAQKQYRFTSTKGLEKRVLSPSAGAFNVAG